MLFAFIFHVILDGISIFSLCNLQLNLRLTGHKWLCGTICLN